MKYMYNKMYFQIHAHAQILIIQRNFEKKRESKKNPVLIQADMFYMVDQNLYFRLERLKFNGLTILCLED